MKKVCDFISIANELLCKVSLQKNKEKLTLDLNIYLTVNMEFEKGKS